MKKRIRSFLLAMLLVLSLFPSAMAAGTDSEVELRLSAEQSSDQVTLSVYLTAQGANNGRILIKYDSDVLKLSVTTPNSSYVTSCNTDADGEVAFAWVGSDLPSARRMMVLEFKVIDAEADETTFYGEMVELYDGEVEMLGDAQYTASEVVVLDGSTTSTPGPDPEIPVDPPVIPPVAPIPPSTPVNPNPPSVDPEDPEDPAEPTVEVVTNPDGSTTTTIVDADGTTTVTVEEEDGTIATTVTDEYGNVVDMNVNVPEVADGETVTLPVEVEVSDNANVAVPVDITIPETVENVTIEIPVDDLSATSVIVLVHPDGTEEVVPKTAMTEEGLAITVDSSVTIKVVDNKKDYVDTDMWAAEAIDFVTSRELFGSNGTEGVFDPDATMTRAMLATVLWRLEGKEIPDGESAFGDVDADKWYSDAIAWANETGIMTGYGDSFGTNDPITREQMITILWRLVGEPAANTTVDGTSDFAADAMAWAVEIGLIQGDENGDINAKGTASRAAVATILMRFMGL